MNTKGGWIYPPHEPPNTQRTANAVQFENMKSPSGDIIFIASLEMFHESSSSDDDHEVKAWWEMCLETYTYTEAYMDL